MEREREEKGRRKGKEKVDKFHAGSIQSSMEEESTVTSLEKKKDRSAVVISLGMFNTVWVCTIRAYVRSTICIQCWLKFDFGLISITLYPT